jgi:hypothetical protein
LGSSVEVETSSGVQLGKTGRAEEAQKSVRCSKAALYPGAKVTLVSEFWIWQIRGQVTS